MMRHLTEQERMLIFALLGIAVLGSCVKYCRKKMTLDTAPELSSPAAATAVPGG